MSESSQHDHEAQRFEYELVDFGADRAGCGRKLERFGEHLVDRPCPAADRATRKQTRLWQDSTSRFDGQSKTWSHRSAWPDDAAISVGLFRIPVRPTPHGHVGVFPEQADNWRWLAENAADRPQAETHCALNLFAYTGASSMALSAGGYAVTHVDAARPNVLAARRVAECNGWLDRPIRYLVDDARAFVQREHRRGRRYHTIVLDPPTYGHAPKGRKAAAQGTWRIERDLFPLLRDLQAITASGPARWLVTGHSEVPCDRDVANFVGSALSPRFSRARISCARLTLLDRERRRLDAGWSVRIQIDP
ncbi:MAG: class I SAM-dependent methyltransferase [Planctomycetota bacterium]